MFELLLTLFTGGGAMGLGSIMKMGAGVLDSRAAANELKEKRKLLSGFDNAQQIIDYQAALTPESEGGLFTRHTRRMLALIGVLTLSVCTIHCVICADLPFYTLPSVARAGAGESNSFSILFGFVEIPRSDKPISLTLGHLAALNFISLNMILGFYFTPGGRK